MSEQETDVMAILQRMQQQLTYLEKKLDTLIQNSQRKPFNPERNFSRPFRPFNRPNGPSHGPSHGHGGHGGHSGHGPSHGGNFAPKKKPFFGRNRERN